jgi:hypothetical protein
VLARVVSLSGILFLRVADVKSPRTDGLCGLIELVGEFWMSNEPLVDFIDEFE